MAMEEIDKVEEKLRGKGWSGDPEKAKALANPDDVLRVRRHAHWLHLSLAVVACLVVGVVSSLVTWSVYFGQRSGQTGSGENDDTMAYVKQLGSHYYPTAVGSLSDSANVYADLYYAFNSSQDNYLVIAINKKEAFSVKLYDVSGLPMFSLSREIGSVGSKTLSITFSAEIETLNGSTISLAVRTIDFSPFYNSLMAQ